MAMDDRERAFESKFANSEELRFKVEARRNKLVGLWAAELLGKQGETAAAYAKDVVMADFDEPGDDDVLRKVLGDLHAAGLAVTREEVRARMDAAFAEAKRQLMQEG